MSVIPAMGRDVEAEGQAVTGAEAEVVIEAVRIDPITATLIARGRHHAPPALALNLLTTLAILLLSDCILKPHPDLHLFTKVDAQNQTGLHHPQATGTLILPDPLIGTAPATTETK